MIRASSGAEFCTSHNISYKKPSDCAKAIDHTYQGDVDLSSLVVMGEPVQKSPLHWSVPYNVKDDAGNEATTVWRDVMVQEVDLTTVESKIRQDVMKEQQAETEKAIRKAIREEKIKWEKDYAATTNSNSRTNRRTTEKTCSACPACDCPKQQRKGGSAVEVDGESCRAYCDNVSRSCTLSDDRYIYAALFWLEDMLPPSIVPTVLGALVALCAFFGLRYIANLIFNPRSYQSYDYGDYGVNNDDILLRNQVVQQSRPPPPRDSLSTNNNSAAFFSPGSQAGLQSPPPSNGLLNNNINRTPATPASANRRDQEIYDESIYSPSIITPSRMGEGVRRRNPYT
jgi:hypothetical protein